MSASAQAVLNDISLAASAAAPLAPVIAPASPAAALVVSLAPVFINIMQRVVADQATGTETSAQLAVEWGDITSAMQGTHLAVQALVAKEEAAHAVASTPASAGANVVTGPTPVAVP